MYDEIYQDEQTFHSAPNSTESSPSGHNQCFADAFCDWSQPKKNKKKKKKKKKKATKNLEARLDKVLIQNGQLKHENNMLRQMMHLALAASRQTLRQEPIDVGFKILD